MKSTLWKKPEDGRRYFVDDFAVQITQLWPEKRADLGASEDPNPLWYEAIAGRVPLGCYLVTVCYAIAVISLGLYPWNFLLIGLLFLIRNKPLRERARRSGRAWMLIGPADRRVVHSDLNGMKVTFAVSRSRR